MAGAGDTPGAFDRALDRADAISLRYERALGAVGLLWFALTCADYAGFVSLPKFALITGVSGLILSGLFNALWWGFVYPRAEKRRAERALQSPEAKMSADG